MGGVVVPPIFEKKDKTTPTPANAPDRASQPYAQSFALTSRVTIKKKQLNATRVLKKDKETTNAQRAPIAMGGGNC